MRKNIYIAMLAFSVLACGCTKTGTEDQKKLVPVNITLSTSGATRSETALFPEVENWIWDFYYVQFDARGTTVRAGHLRTATTTGELSVSDQVYLYADNGTTVLIIANIRPNGTDYINPQWGTDDNLHIGNANSLPTMQTVLLNISDRVEMARLNQLQHMPMCGYWKGNIEIKGYNTIHVALGRMMTRMNVNVKNNTSSTITSVTLNNVATRAYIYPQAHNKPLPTGVQPGEENAYTSFTDVINIPAGESRMLYFYTAPNYCETDAKATSITFTSGSRNWTKKLGDNPGENDYNLYMNTIYTFNLELTQ